MKDILFDAGVRAVSWNPIKKELVAAGLVNGKIKIINSENSQITHNLFSSEQKIFCLQWHPFFDYILASGSLDRTVKVWDIKNVRFIVFIVREWAQEPSTP